MLFNFVCYLSFLLFNPIPVYANSFNTSSQTRNQEDMDAKDESSQLTFNEILIIEKLVSAGLISRISDARISLNTGIRDSIKEKCPNHLNAIDSLFSGGQNYAPRESIEAVKSGLDGCGKDIYVSYKNLSDIFVERIASAYKFQDKYNYRGATDASQRSYIDPRFVKFVSRNMSPSQPENVSEIRQKILAYDDFDDHCFLVFSLFVFDKTSAVGYIDPQSYMNLHSNKYKDLQKSLLDTKCWSQKEEFEEFIKAKCLRIL